MGPKTHLTRIITKTTSNVLDDAKTRWRQCPLLLANINNIMVDHATWLEVIILF